MDDVLLWTEKYSTQKRTDLCDRLFVGVHLLQRYKFDMSLMIEGKVEKSLSCQRMINNRIYFARNAKYIEHLTTFSLWLLNCSYY